MTGKAGMGTSALRQWTDDDRFAAGREGWDLFLCPDSDDGGVQLQALVDGPDGWPEGAPIPFCDAPGTLPRDDLVWLHVVQRARDGSALHAKALTVLDVLNPSELLRIVRFAAEHGQE